MQQGAKKTRKTKCCTRHAFGRATHNCCFAHGDTAGVGLVTSRTTIYFEQHESTITSIVCPYLLDPLEGVGDGVLVIGRHHGRHGRRPGGGGGVGRPGNPYDPPARQAGGDGDLGGAGGHRGIEHLEAPARAVEPVGCGL
jgi:hypothetical protein